MPNHITNKITYSDEFRELIESCIVPHEKHGEIFDFDVLIKCPEELKNTQEKYISDSADGLTDEMRKNLVKYGFTSGYDWRIKNWGTKWGAYEFERLSPNSIQFQTAWSTPKPIWLKIAELMPPEFSGFIEIQYADEDFGHNCGTIRLEDEACKFTTFIRPGFKSREFAFAVLHSGKKPQDCGYDDNYEYIEEEDEHE